MVWGAIPEEEVLSEIRKIKQTGTEKPIQTKKKRG
jgi:hypothetical protein